jgi:DNA-binding transcriptional LysR family regulator
VNLEELHWFVVLAETEHVTEAAAELQVSQPTLSRALRRFEREAGTPLFDRVNRRLRLNAYGQIMLEHARRSIAEMRSATERIAALRDPDTGRVRLAFLHSLANWYVPEQLRRFRESAPVIGFDLFQGPAHEITRRVLDGQADIAVTAPRPQAAGFVWRRLYVDQLCLAVPHGHRLAGRAKVRLSAAAGEPFIALGEQAGLRQLTDQLLADDGVDPDICSRPPRSPLWKGWSLPVSVSPSFPFRETKVSPRLSTSRFRTPAPSARWVSSGTRHGICRRLRSVSRSSSAMMRQMHDKYKNYALDT